MLHLEGIRFAKLLVLGRTRNNIHQQTRWRCLCDCGNKISVHGYHLKAGHTRSCGCLRSDPKWFKSPNLKDVSGKRFGNILVLRRAKNSKSGKARWSCVCDCGKKFTRPLVRITKGSLSCGCLKGQKISEAKFKHGLSGKPIYCMYHAAKFRAARDGVPFLLEFPSGIPAIPEKCPILGITLKIGVGTPTDCSPTLDRIIPELGYVANNIKIISYRANRLKSDATIDETRMILRYLESNELPNLPVA